MNNSSARLNICDTLLDHTINDLSEHLFSSDLEERSAKTDRNLEKKPIFLMNRHISYKENEYSDSGGLCCKPRSIEEESFSNGVIAVKGVDHNEAPESFKPPRSLSIKDDRTAIAPPTVNQNIQSEVFRPIYMHIHLLLIILN